jgi:DHA1 family inner membrane transport protein
MLLLRIVIAVAHGTYFGAAMVVAVKLVPEDRRGMAVAIVLAGLTVSGVLGVPAGTAIGNLYGWRATFWAMFALGLVSTAAMLVLLPRTPGSSAPPAGLAREVRVLGRQQVWTSLILMLLLMIAQFVPYTYIVPLLREVTGLEPALIPWVLLLNGAGATAGVFVGGRLASWKLMPSMIVLFAVQAAVMATMYFVSADPPLMIATITIWGCLNFAIGTPIQTRILSWTVDAPNLASSLIPSGFNFGIAIAATIGALLLGAGFGYANLPVLGIFAMLTGAVIALGSHLRERRSGATPPLATPA